MNRVKKTRVPGWAESLVELVMAHEGVAVPPELAWTCGPMPDGYRAKNSLGVTSGNLIAVDEGTSERDARHTLVHELAHWATESGHTVAMYAKMYELLWLFGEGDDLEYARLREHSYQPMVSEQGWARFSARVDTWRDRVNDYLERILASPIPRVVLPVLAVILGVDSMQRFD